MHADRALRILTLADRHGTMSRAEIERHLADGQRAVAVLRNMVAREHLALDRADGLGLYSLTHKGRLALRAAQHQGCVAAPRENHIMDGHYRPAPWRPELARPGASDHVNVPSLIGEQRVYRKDAQVAKVAA